MDDFDSDHQCYHLACVRNCEERFSNDACECDHHVAFLADVVF